MNKELQTSLWGGKIKGGKYLTFCLALTMMAMQQPCQGYAMDTAMGSTSAAVMATAESTSVVQADDADTTNGVYFEYRILDDSSQGQKQVEVTGLKAKNYKDLHALTEIDIPENVTIGRTQYTVVSIGEKAFYNSEVGRDAQGLVTAKIPATVETIGDSAFARILWKLGKVEFASGSKLKKIGNCAFQYVYNLSEFTIPDGVESIGDYAFDLVKFKSLEVPSSVTTIGTEAFVIPSLRKITFKRDLSQSSSTDAVSYSPKAMNSIQYRSLNKVIVPKGAVDAYKEIFTEQKNFITDVDNEFTAKVGDYTYSFEINEAEGNTVTCNGFAGEVTAKIQTLSLPAKVTVTTNDEQKEYTVSAIGKGAFSKCDIQEVVIPNVLESIGENAFSSCNSLNKVTFAMDNSRLKTIGRNAFESTGLTEIRIPANVETIGMQAFFLSQIATVTFASASKLTNLGGAAFSSTPLRTITIPASVTTLGNELFQNCNSLEAVEFEENSHAELLSSIFYGCPLLKSLTLPAGVASVNNGTFDKSSLEYIQLKGETKLVNNMELPKTLKAICVPESLAASYKETYSSLADKIYPVQDTPLELTDGSNFDVSSYEGKVWEPGKASYTRTLKATDKNGFITVCLPFNVLLKKEGVEKLYLLDSDENGDYKAVTYKDGVYQLPVNDVFANDRVIASGVGAGIPMLIKLSDDVSEGKKLTFTNADYLMVDDELEDVLKPTSLDITMAEGAEGEAPNVNITCGGTFKKYDYNECKDFYTFTNKGIFGKQKENLGLNPFRMYLTITDKTTGQSVQNARFSANAGNGGGTTGITVIPVTPVATASESSAIYTLDGRKVENGANGKASLPKGIYIVGGKKVVVK